MEVSKSCILFFSVIIWISSWHIHKGKDGRCNGQHLCVRAFSRESLDPPGTGREPHAGLTCGGPSPDHLPTQNYTKITTPPMRFRIHTYLI